jgi:hypothetical protein
MNMFNNTKSEKTLSRRKRSKQQQHTNLRVKELEQLKRSVDYIILPGTAG